MGSHSRKKFRPGAEHPADRCPLDADRLVLLEGRVEPDGIAWSRPVRFDLCAFGGEPSAKMRRRGEGCPHPEQSALGGLRGCLEGLFVVGQRESEDAAALCRELVRGARDAARDAASCGRTLNIEGAAVVREGDTHRVWLGLRAPLLEEGAVLVRLAEPLGAVRALRFDAVARLKLPPGRGVRGLTKDGGRVLALHGPELDAAEPIGWVAFPAAELRAGARIEPRGLEGVLPPSTEGLAVLGAEVGFVVDGDEGDDPRRCAGPAGAFRLPRPGGG